MKKIFALTAFFAIALTACSDPGDDKGIPETAALLKISNNSRYALYNVWYSSSEFEDINIGGNKTMNVSPDSLNPIYFALSINNRKIQCYTMDEIMCEKGKTKEFNIINDRVVTAIESQKTDTIKGIYEALSKPIFQLSQDETVIVNNDPLPFDFGQAELGANRQTVFTIKNIGNLPLELTGDPVILSSNAVFTVPSQPANKSINPGSSIAFILQYSPIEEREDTATISIFNNSDDLVFTLNVKGNGYVKRPQITVQQGSIPIAQYGEYNFGGVMVNETKDITFTIGNSGEAHLSFVNVNGNCVNIIDNTGDGFALIQQPSEAMVVPPGNTAVFVIRYSPTVEGYNYVANVQIKTNSYDEIFSFWIKGGTQIIYTIGDTGPAGGIIFYDAGVELNGWRYLEAALIDFNAQWGPYGMNIPGTGLSIGDGKQNTQLIVAELNLLGETGQAAQLCTNLNSGGYNDWFLPSRDELNLLYTNLHKKGLGNFNNSYDPFYWSSSQYQYNTVSAWYQAFSDGSQEYMYKDFAILVRAVRAF